MTQDSLGIYGELIGLRAVLWVQSCGLFELGVDAIEVVFPAIDVVIDGLTDHGNRKEGAPRTAGRRRRLPTTANTCTSGSRKRGTWAPSETPRRSTTAMIGRQRLRRARHP